MFSDLNNLNVVTTTPDEYSSCFGFTEEELIFSVRESLILIGQIQVPIVWQAV